MYQVITVHCALKKVECPKYFEIMNIGTLNVLDLVEHCA
jgi:hypothetical protein